MTMKTKPSRALISVVSLLFPMMCSGDIITPLTSFSGISSGDLFQYTNLNITGSSPVVSGSDVRDMFGGHFGSFGDATIFVSNGVAGFDYTVSFTTTSPINLSAYSLYLAEDTPAFGSTEGARSVTRFRLLAGSTIISDVLLLNAGQTYAGRYGAADLGGIAGLLMNDTFAPVTSSSFQAIFTSNNFGNNGPRVLELDAVGTIAPVPEPSTMMPMLVIVVLGCISARRFANPNR